MQLTLFQLTEKRKAQSKDEIVKVCIEFLLPESEAWCLVRGVVSALLFLQQNDIPHGMLSLHNIYFDEEYLLYRVYDQELISGRWGSWLRCQGF